MTYLAKAVAWIVIIAATLGGAYVAKGAPKSGAHIEELKDGGRRITLDAEQAKHCDDNGGCIIVPKDVLGRAIEMIVDQECGKVGI